MKLVVWASPTTRGRLDAVLGAKVQQCAVGSLAEFIAARAEPSNVGILDYSTVAPAFDCRTLGTGEIIAFCDGTVSNAVQWLANDALSHVASVSMLDHPSGPDLLDNVLATINTATKPRLLDWLTNNVVGRRVRLTHAGGRAERLDKLSDFFTTHGFGVRTVEQIRDAAEELLTNAFYDAPAASGLFKKPVSRTQDVELPSDSACDLAYGYRDQLAVVRIRDPFGSLTRKRLIEVLLRCSSSEMDVRPDESMGGAGLGMWKIFASATFVAVSVVNHRHTEILVGFTKRNVAGARTFGFHLFFREGTKRRFWTIRKDDDTERAAINRSVVLLEKTK
ncbi:MAG TPA: hypothetical protein VGC41_24450 [Kofleriaceae bacterium]